MVITCNSTNCLLLTCVLSIIYNPDNISKINSVRNISSLGSAYPMNQSHGHEYSVQFARLRFYKFTVFIVNERSLRRSLRMYEYSL